VILLTETNVPHAENVAYFGDGDEAHMVYQFPLPPLLLHALLNGSATALTRWAAGLDAPPPGCTFFNFTASHDGIGVRPLEGLVPPAEVDALLEAIAARGGQVSCKRNADGSTSPYELNITWFAALGPPAGTDDPHHHARFLASQIIAAGLAGVPAFYLHALTASPNDTAGATETGRARSINRRRWPAAELEALLADPATPAARTLTALTALLKVRAGQPAFHPEAPQQALDLGPDVFAFTRSGPRHGPPLLALHNVTGRTVDVAMPEGITPAGTDLLDPGRTGLARGPVPLAPYQCRWLPLTG
jgi:sucrose phosphorylase